MVQLRYSRKLEEPRAPRRWSILGRWLIQRASVRLGLRPPFSLTWWDMRVAPPPWQEWIEARWASFQSSHQPFAWSLFAACVVGLLVWSRLDTNLRFDQIWPEVGGMALDVFVILIVYETHQGRRAHKAEIARQHEIIDDYKRWDADEGRLRIAGAIRRLNRQRIYNVDLSGAILSDFAFASAGIKRLTGSTFYDGTWGEPHRQTEVSLTRVSFDWVECNDVLFSPYDPFEALSTTAPRAARLIDCSFFEADLRNATFNGAELAWTGPPLEELYEYEDDEEGGCQRHQVAFGKLHGAKLSGASFRACIFRNADFRGVEDLSLVDFFRAEGLEEAKFDCDADRDCALTSARRPKDRDA